MNEEDSPRIGDPVQVTTGLHEQPAGVSDADRLAAAIRGTPAKPKLAWPGSGHPVQKKRGRPIRPRPEPRRPEEAAPELVSTEAAREQLSDLSRALAAMRARRFEPEGSALSPEDNLLRAYTMSEPLAAAAAGDFSRVINRYLPAAEERPELRLALILAPWILGIVVAELAYYQHVRAARRPAPRGQRDAVRPEGLGKDDPDEITIGAPFPMPDR